MKRIGFQLGIALITFCLGVGAAWGGLLISQPPIIAIEPPPLSVTITRPMLQAPPASPSEPATIVFIRSYKNRYGLILAGFKVTNVSNQPLYYLSQGSVSHNRNWYIRRGSLLERADLSCATGMSSRMLSPGKSVTLEVVTGEEPGRMQVGFDFFVGNADLSQTSWSDEVYISD